LGSLTSGEDVVEAFDLVVGDLRKDPCEPGLRVDVVQLGGLDEGEGDQYGFAAAFETGEHRAFLRDSQWFERTRLCFCRAPVGRFPSMAMPSAASQGRSEWLGPVGLSIDLGQLGLQPGIQIIEDRLCPCLP
jgi:hypothetical protein